MEKLYNTINYIQLFQEYLIHDRKDFLQISFDDLENIESRLPEHIITNKYVSYNIKYHSETFDSLDDFNEEIQITYDKKIDKKNGAITVKFNKVELLNKYNNALSNSYVYVNIKNFCNDFTSIKFNDPEKKMNIFIFDDIPIGIENNYLRLLNVNQIVQTNNKNIDKKSITCFDTIKDMFANKSIVSYLEIPHFWNFDVDYEVLKICKQNCVLAFFNIISNKILKNNSEYLIKGHHNLTFKLDFKSYDNINTGNYVDLLDFTLDKDEKRNLDKLLILRNVITNYLNNDSVFWDFNNQIEQISETANHHFELYIENEIKIFIEQKNQLLNETLEVAKKVSNQTTATSVQLRNLILTLLGGILASFISTTFDIKSTQEVTILNTFFIILLLYLMVNLFISRKIRFQYLNNLKVLKQYINTISSNSLKGLDYESLKKKFINPEEENFYSILKFHNFIIIMLSILGIAFIIFFNKDYIFYIIGLIINFIRSQVNL